MTRGAVVLTNGNLFAGVILRGLMAREGLITGVVEVTGDYKGRAGFSALYHLLKTTTVPYVIYKVIVVLASRIVGTLRRGPSGGTFAGLKLQGVPFMSVSDISDPAVEEFIRTKAPELLVSVSCPQRIPARLLALPTLAAINIHSSLLPRYAGLAPYYWVLVNDERVTGTTVHFMTEKFDAGNILAQKQLEIRPHMSAFQLFLDLAVAGSEALASAVEKVLAGDNGRSQDFAGRTYVSNPDFKSYVQLRKNGFRLLRLRDLGAFLRL